MASGEPVARPFDKKMVFILESYFPPFAKILKVHFGVIWGGGGMENKEIGRLLGRFFLKDFASK